MKRERPRHAGGVFALREEEGPQKRARGQLLHAKKIDDEQYREYCQTEQYFEHFATSLTVNDSVPGFVVAESRGDGVFCKPVFGRQAVESFVYASDLAAVRAHGRGSAHAEIVLRLVGEYMRLASARRRAQAVQDREARHGFAVIDLVRPQSPGSRW